MSSKDAYDKMSKEEKQELDKLMKEITEAAKKVVKDYAENPSEENETDIQIDYDSPYLDEIFEGDIFISGKNGPDFTHFIGKNRGENEKSGILIL